MKPDPMIMWLSNFIDRRGRAPTAAEIRTAANFGEPGGIERLCAALAYAAARTADQRRSRAA